MDSLLVNTAVTLSRDLLGIFFKKNVYQQSNECIDIITSSNSLIAY